MGKKWLTLLCVGCLLLTAAACGKTNNMQRQYVALVQSCLKDGDTAKAEKVLNEALKKLPEDPDLLALQQELKDDAQTTVAVDEVEDTTAAQSQAQTPNLTVPTAEQTAKEFAALRRLYQKWYVPDNIKLNYSVSRTIRVPDAVSGTHSETAYAVQENGVTDKESLDALFARYCTSSMIQSFSDIDPYAFYGEISMHYVDVDGQLYCAQPEMSFTMEDGNLRVQKNADDTFQVQMDTLLWFSDGSARGGFTELAHISAQYVPTEDGYRFDRFAMSSAGGSDILYGTYIVSTSGSDLMLHSFPDDSEESRIGTVNQNAVVDVVRSVAGWAYINTQDGKIGWVSTQYLKPYEEPAGGYVPQQNTPVYNNPPSYNGGNAVDQIINGGLQVADGILSAIF